MASAIGIRIYRIGVNERGSPTPLTLNSSKINVTVPRFISDFVANHTSDTQNAELERSWYFELKNEDEPGNIQGYVHYGTYGFESNFVNNKTRKRNYHRQVTDIEEIPLYYEFRCPKDETFGFVAFQSFQGRSCISLVMKQMKELFEKKNDGYILTFRKILPSDAGDSAFFSAPVKQLRFIKRNTSSDFADKYFSTSSPDPIDFEIVISARRKRNLGSLKALLTSMKGSANSIITHEGVEFPEAVAEIRVGGRTRRVGVLGANSDAGVIDLTDVIVRGQDGHPTFDSLRKEADLLLRDLYETMSSTKT